MYEFFRQFLFKLKPETAHNLAKTAAKIAPKVPFLLESLSQKYCTKNPILAQDLLGLHFYNPVGLAAGFDKDAQMLHALLAFGFSHIELGAITRVAQPGNDGERLWRYVEEQSLQNAMGFNNEGAESIAPRIERYYPFAVPLGANVGKNRTTELKDARTDYIALCTRFKNCSDYLCVNISSPNTPNLRDLQNENFVKETLEAICTIYKKPIFFKLSPDLSVDSSISIAQTAIDNGASGIIATNTSTDYSLLNGAQDKGGLSGKVLKEKSRQITKELGKAIIKPSLKNSGENGKKAPILISVGGIDSGAEAYNRIRNGASLVQIYTALIFKGPALVKAINDELVDLLQKDGFTHISQAVGADL